MLCIVYLAPCDSIGGIPFVLGILAGKTECELVADNRAAEAERCVQRVKTAVFDRCIAFRREGWTLGDHVDGATRCITAVEGSLWSAKNFNTIKVIEG